MNAPVLPHPRPDRPPQWATGTGLSVDVLVRRQGFQLEVDFAVDRGSVLAVLGPNGAGKSTLLGLLAGLVTPGRGRIALDDRVLTDSAAGVGVPVHRRGVGLLAQDALLFPHLSAHDNVAFGPRAAGRSRVDARDVADRWLAEVGATELATARPRELSGGQAQRVAVARALAADPELLLLDEPMAALDVDAAPAIRALLRRVLDADGRTTVLVTHDPLDALVLADRVIVLSDGRIVEDGRTRDVLARPRTAFTARIAGLNLIPGRLCAEGIVVDGGLRISGRHANAGSVEADSVGRDGVAGDDGAGGGARADDAGASDGRALPDDAFVGAEGEPGVAVFAPRAVAVYRERPSGSPRNVLTGVVAGIEPHGDGVRIRAAAAQGGPSWVDGVAADVTHAAVADLRLQPGSPVWFTVKATEVAVHRVAGG